MAKQTMFIKVEVDFDVANYRKGCSAASMEFEPMDESRIHRRLGFAAEAGIRRHLREILNDRNDVPDFTVAADSTRF